MPVFTVTSVGVKVLPQTPLIVKSIRWIAATTAGHGLRFEDTNGLILFRSVAAGANNVEESIAQRIWRNGLNVVTISSGEVDIEYEYFGETIY